MIRPISIDDAQLRDGRCPPLRLLKVLLAELQILEAHRKSLVSHERLESRLIERIERFEHLNVGRFLIVHVQRFRFFQARLTALHGIDAVILDFRKVFAAHITDNDDDAGRSDPRTLFLRDQLYTLGC